MSRETSGLKVYVVDEIFNFASLEEKNPKSCLKRTASHNAIVHLNKNEVYMPNDRRVNRPENFTTQLYGRSYNHHHNKHCKQKKQLFRRSITQGIGLSQSSNVLIDPRHSLHSVDLKQTHSSSTDLVKSPTIHRRNVNHNDQLQPSEDLLSKDSLKDTLKMSHKIQEVYLPKEDVLINIRGQEVENDFSDSDFTLPTNSYRPTNSDLSDLIPAVKSSRTVPLLAHRSDSDITLCDTCTNKISNLAYKCDDDDDGSVNKLKCGVEKENKKIVRPHVFLLSVICGLIFTGILALLAIQHYPLILHKLRFGFATPPPEPLWRSYLNTVSENWRSCLNIVSENAKYSWKNVYDILDHYLLVPRGGPNPHK